jgi:solute carrier family 25 carnitine/acylcarnitine transporter 20/29
MPTTEPGQSSDARRGTPAFWASLPSSFDSFLAGFGYGAVSVIVGQPFDTIKTRAQMNKYAGKSSFQIGRDVFASEGVYGLYRGGTSLVLGGSLIRSAQFGVNEAALRTIRSVADGPVLPKDRWLGVFDWQVIIAGVCGGIGRGLIEGPFEYVKVRRQLMEPWKFREVFSGSGATIGRNSFLFSAFVVYLDISKQIIPGGLSPFWQGAICANMAWFTIWPMDVVKTMLQSGHYVGKSVPWLLRETMRTGAMFRGLLPGLVRSTLANGSAMVAYNRIQSALVSEREWARA